MFLNWALGLRSLGCRVIWLTSVFPGISKDQVRADVAELKRALQPFGLGEHLALMMQTGEDVPSGMGETFDGEAATQADFFLNLAYLPPAIVRRFRRSAFVDIDPGLTQNWISRGE